MYAPCQQILLSDSKDDSRDGRFVNIPDNSPVPRFGGYPVADAGAQVGSGGAVEGERETVEAKAEKRGGI